MLADLRPASPLAAVSSRGYGPRPRLPGFARQPTL